MQSNYLLSMKSARAAIIRARLGALKEQTWKAYHQAQENERAAWFIGNELADFSEVETEVTSAQEQVTRLWKRIESLSFRLSMVQEPVCAFCGGTWGLSQEVDMRFGVTRKQAVRKGCFWCCGSCYAHVLNAAYSNLPEMRPKQ